MADANVPAIRQVCAVIASPEMQAKIRQALPQSVSLDRFTRTALTALQINPSVADADRQSLYNAVVRAAQDGLLPDNREAALVVFSTKRGDQWIKAVQYMPMVGGLIKRLAQSGITIDAQTVCEGDTFDYELGDDAKIVHKRPKLGTKRGEIIGAYAIARLANGMVMREVMDRSEIDQIRSASKSKDGGPWSQWFGEMARKSVIRRLAKRLPITDPSITETITADDELTEADASPAVVETVPTEPAATRAASKVKAAMAQAEDASIEAVEPTHDSPPGYADGDTF